MSHVAHELPQKFPDKVDKIHDLKINNAHFAKLMDAYHELNHKIHRIEARGSDRSDAAMEELKKQRVQLLDELSVILEE